MSMPRPRIAYFAMGGTIASVRADLPGAEPTLSADDIAATVPGLLDVVDLRAYSYRLIPSPQITVADLGELVDRMRAAVGEGAVGFVVTQGTDTIEETSFVLDLLWNGPEPIVVTGAMRNPSLPGADGPANLLSAALLAADPDARDCGVLVCLNDEIHAARYVHKSHTSSLATFVSPGLGPIGWVSEGRPVIALRPTRRAHITAAPGLSVPSVGIVKLGLSDDCRLLGGAADLGYDGVVVEAAGGGHVPVAALPHLDRLVQQGVPVVLTSRTGSGEVLSETYRFPGSEIDLLERGLLRAGSLDALKARLLLTLCLAAGYDRSQLIATLQVVGTTTGPIAPSS